MPGVVQFFDDIRSALEDCGMTIIRDTNSLRIVVEAAMVDPCLTIEFVEDLLYSGATIEIGYEDSDEFEASVPFYDTTVDDIVKIVKEIMS